MQAIMETIFDTFYLVAVITLGVLMIRRSRGNKTYWLYGVMAVVLGGGDAFHLVPRMIALCTTGMESYTAVLGFGKAVTSVTMTAFYMLMYAVSRQRYQVTGHKGLTVTVLGLAALRVLLCLCPGNEWLAAKPPIIWGVWRNIPFLALGVVMIVLFYRKHREDPAFRFLWLTIVLSFAFYLPVTLWSQTAPWVGVLMIPKTCAYLWAVWIGYADMQKSLKAQS